MSSSPFWFFWFIFWFISWFFSFFFALWFRTVMTIIVIVIFFPMKWFRYLMWCFYYIIEIWIFCNVRLFLLFRYSIYSFSFLFSFLSYKLVKIKTIFFIFSYNIMCFCFIFIFKTIIPCHFLLLLMIRLIYFFCLNACNWYNIILWW